MDESTHDGMTMFCLRHTESGETAEYECCDLACAQMLAADDHGGEPNEWHTGLI